METPAVSSRYVKPAEEQERDKDADIHEDNHPVTTCHPLSCVLGVLCFPITLCSCYTIQERESAVLLTYGKYAGTVKEPGIHWANVWGRDLRKISTKVISVDLPHTKVIDANGNPLLISGVLTYQFVSPKKAVLDVENANKFVYTQAQAALKQIVSRYPYESDIEGTHCLKSESANIGNEMVSILQARVNISGTKIHSFAFQRDLIRSRDRLWYVEAPTSCSHRGRAQGHHPRGRRDRPRCCSRVGRARSHHG